MAAYPNFAQSFVSSEVTKDDLRMQRSAAGNARVRSMYAHPVKQFSVVHESMTDTQRRRIRDFYDVNKTSTFTFVWSADGLAYLCVFTGPPQFAPQYGGLWTVKCMMEEI